MLAFGFMRQFGWLASLYTADKARVELEFVLCFGF